MIQPTFFCTFTVAKQTPGIKTEGFTIKLEDSKLKESQDEKKRKRKIKKRMKKGLPVNSNELTPVNGASNSIIKGPIPVLMPHPRSEPRQVSVTVPSAKPVVTY